MKKCKTLAYVVFVLVFVSGCTTLRPNESMEKLLNRSPKPVQVVSVSDEGNGYASALFRDAKGKFFTIAGPQFATLKAGDVLY